MTPHARLISLLATSLLPACHPTCPSAEPLGLTGKLKRMPPNPAKQLKKASREKPKRRCSDSVASELACRIPGAWIDPEGSCPEQEKAQWTTKPVFAEATDRFERFCLYRPKDETSKSDYAETYRSYYRQLDDSEELLVALREELDLPDTAQPVFYSLPQASPELEPGRELEYTVEERVPAFRAKNGLANRAAIAEQVELREQHGVLVAVIDTAPRVPFEGKSQHGKTVACIAADYALGGVFAEGKGELPRRVETFPGLPRWRDYGMLDIPEPTWDTGGNGGLTTDLAAQIYEAVRYWREHRPEDRLIINLSVGWNTLGRGLRAKAVKAALEYASCYGALTIVASGNKPMDGCQGPPAEPSEPSVFERESRPTESACRDYGVDEQDIVGPCEEGSYCPLVHAITPLDFSDAHLKDFREGSDSRLAALGMLGAAPNVTSPMTGSSVASAVVSGVAATVWSLNPDLRADQVMQLIHDSTDPASPAVTAQQHYGRTSPEQHIVDACRVVRAAVARHDESHAPDPEQVQPLACDQGWSPETIPYERGVVLDRPKKRGAKRDCGPTVTVYGPPEFSFSRIRRELRSIGAPLRDRLEAQWPELPGASRRFRPGKAKRELLWVGPQPGHVVCPWCRIETDEGELEGATVILALNSTDFDNGLRASQVVLSVWNETGYEDMYIYAEGDLRLMNAGVESVFIEPTLFRPTEAWVTISLYDSNDPAAPSSSHSQQIPVDPPQ